MPKLNFEGDFWALPGGFVFQHEGIDEAAYRILQERTGLRNVFLEQFKVFGSAQRSGKESFGRLLELNPEKFQREPLNQLEFDWLTQRFVSIGYYALVDINHVVPQKTELDEHITWYDIRQLPDMIIDHNEQVQDALEILRVRWDHELVGFNLLPEKFTMKELQHLYEAVYDRPFRRNNFQKKMLNLGVLERLEKKYTGASNKAPYLYRFKQ